MARTPGESAQLGGDPRPSEGRPETVETSAPTPSTDASTLFESRPLPPLPDGLVAVALLGRGGMGVVVQATDRATGEDVAVKVILSEARERPSARIRFQREAEALARLHHPAIVRVRRFEPDGLALVMELVPGETLRAALLREGRLPAARVRAIALPLLDALAEAHDAGLVHRDVKPANVILRGPSDPVLVDFGVASVGASELSTPGGAIGTTSYMPPEQLRGQQVDARADLYALAATLFEAATGERLHARAPGSETPEQRVLAATGDRALARALDTALRERASERFPSAREFRRELEPRPVLLLPAPWRARSVVSVAGALATAALFAGGLWWRERAPATTREVAPAIDRGVDRALVAARAALVEHRFAEADTELARALAIDPGAAEALYLGAIVAWWAERPAGDIRARIEAATRASLSPEQRAFLVGLEALVTGRPLEAIEHFRAQSARYPDDRDLLYGLFEAQFHTGDGDAAWTTYRALLEAAPTFRLGLLHVFELGVARESVELLDWVLARPGLRADPVYAPWLGRRDLALGELDRAEGTILAVLASGDARLNTKMLKSDRALVLAYRGELDRALEVMGEVFAEEPGLFALPMAALSEAAGSSAEARRFREMSERYLEGLPAWHATSRLELLAYDVPMASSDALEAQARALRVDLATAPANGASTAAMEALAAGFGGDDDALRALAESPYREGRELARAFAAKRAREDIVALRHLEAAIAASPDGHRHPIEQPLAARWAHDARDRASLERLCARLEHPRSIRPTWGTIVGPCQAWRADLARDEAQRRP